MRPISAILSERDHPPTVDDPPYNGDPAAVREFPRARGAVSKAKAARLKVGVITNQAGRRLTHQQVMAVNQRFEERLGPFDTGHPCPAAVTGGDISKAVLELAQGVAV